MHKTIRGLAVLTATTGAFAATTLVPAEAAVQTLRYDRQVGVCESSKTDLPVDFTIRPGDRVTLSAGSDIWSGVWFQNRTGPSGRLGEYGDNTRYPLPGARKFSLLVKMDGGYRYAGSSFSRTAINYYDQTIGLRINDDVPGNGNGCFSVKVKVYR